MTPISHPQSEPPDNEEMLVAYLDGELAPEDCRVVEERLASDVEYRQQLRDLDQAWEALGALPTTTVDDVFARTTIELACVAAEEDLSQRRSLAAVDNRSRTRWWLAGGVATVVMGFVMMRALAVHRQTAQLADLPVIQQANVLAQVENIEFLRQLAKAVPVNEFVREDAAFERDLADFAKANAESFEERRDWIHALSPEQKANVADRARAFEDSRQLPEEQDRQRKLVSDIRREPELQQTLIAFGQWFEHHTPGQQEQLRETYRDLSTTEKVAEIQQRVHQENERTVQRLSADDKNTLRREILSLMEEHKAELQERQLPGSPRRRTTGRDESQLRPALAILGAAFKNKEYGQAMMNRLVGKLSPEAQDHWKNLGRGRDRQILQFGQWFREALQPTWGPEELEQFFTSDKVTLDERQRLLDMPRAEMKNELDRLYLRSEFGIDDRLMQWREFGDGGRGPRNGAGPPEPLRPGDGPPGFRPEGPPPDGRFGPGGPPGDRRFDGDRRPGPGGPRRPRPEDPIEGGRPNGPPRQQPIEPPPPPENETPI